MPEPAAGGWVASARSTYLSVVTIHEIEKGIALLDHKGASARATALRGWLTGLLAGFGNKVMPADATAAAMAGRLEGEAISSGHGPGMADALVAGIARTHDLVVVTMNRRHFIPFAIPVMSPDELDETTPG